MLDRQEISSGLVGEPLLDDVLGVLNLRRKRVQVILCVKVEVDAMVAKGL